MSSDRPTDSEQKDNWCQFGTFPDNESRRKSRSVPEVFAVMGALILCASLAAVDGDTVRCDGRLMRAIGDGSPFVSGFDTPEIGGRARCAAERTAGIAARDRMAELISTPGLTIEDSGAVDRYGRALVALRLPDGRTIGSVLIAEGLARVWVPGYRADWCG